jgi:hypothetical protein
MNGLYVFEGIKVLMFDVRDISAFPIYMKSGNLDSFSNILLVSGSILYYLSNSNGVDGERRLC